MDEDTSYLILQSGDKRYIVLEIAVKSRVHYKDLPAIIAKRKRTGKVSPWVPQEENSVYVGAPKNTVFITNTTKQKVAITSGSNEIQLPEKSLTSNVIEPYVSWHGSEGTLSIKGIKDSTLIKQTRQEYSADIVPSISRNDLAANQVCILEVILPLNSCSFQEVKGYKNHSRNAVDPLSASLDEIAKSHLIEHPTDIVLSGENINNKYVSVLFFVHIGTKLSDKTLEHVKNDLVCPPITLTNKGYRGAVNCSMLIRTLGDVRNDKALPIVFSVKSTDLSKQIFFQAYKY